MTKFAVLMLFVAAATAAPVGPAAAEAAPDMEGAESGYISIVKPGFAAGVGVGPVYPAAYPAAYPMYQYPGAYPGAYAYPGSYNPYYGPG